MHEGVPQQDVSRMRLVVLRAATWSPQMQRRRQKTELSMTTIAKATRLFVRIGRRHAYKLVVGNALLLLCASWLPGRWKPRTEMLSGQAEHAIAYFLTGFAVTLLLAGYRTAWQIALSLVLYAGMLEQGQYFVPGRHASVSDFSVSAAGGLVGVAMAALLKSGIFPYVQGSTSAAIGALNRHSSFSSHNKAAATQAARDRICRTVEERAKRFHANRGIQLLYAQDPFWCGAMLRLAPSILAIDVMTTGGPRSYSLLEH